MNKFWILRNYDMINRIIFHAQNILTGRLEFNGGFRQSSKSWVFYLCKFGYLLIEALHFKTLYYKNHFINISLTKIPLEKGLESITTLVHRL